MINYSRSIIGDETTIRFWLDPWINTIFKPLANYLTGALTKQDLTLNLKEVRSNGHWNFSKLSYPIPKDIQSRITEAYIPHNPQNTTHQDKLCWSITTNAVFTVSSCYHALIVARNSPLNYLGNISNLSWIWKTRLQNKINYFLWLCWHNIIKSNSLLQHRGMKIDPHCQICPTVQENTDHIL